METPDKRIFTRELVSCLNRFTGRPWSEGRNGKEVTDIWLAQQLKPYGVKPRTLWIGEAHAKGYTQDDLMDTFRRYISRSDLEALKAEWASEKRPPAAPPAAPAKTEPAQNTTLAA